jgi:hypothetical protein
MLELILKLLKIKIDLKSTESYEAQYPDVDDLRNSIHPKKGLITDNKPYFQVFEERNGFVPDLSIVDLLFNQGPQAGMYF